MTAPNTQPPYSQDQYSFTEAPPIIAEGEIDTRRRPRTPDILLPGQEPRFRPELKHLYGNNLIPGPYEAPPPGGDKEAPPEGEAPAEAGG